MSTHVAISSIIRWVLSLIVSSYGYGFDKFIMLMILVVDYPRQVSLGHAHASQLEGAGHRHRWKHFEVRSGWMCRLDRHHEFSHVLTEHGKLSLGAKEIVVWLVNRHFP